jgi:hypothetical protein
MAACGRELSVITASKSTAATTGTQSDWYSQL